MSYAGSTFIINGIKACARCGEEHCYVEARALTRPFAPTEAGGLVWTHWFPCPTNGEPVLVMTRES